MNKRWVSVEVDAPAPVVWELLVDLEAWPKWGPSVSRASVDGGALVKGARGRVRTAVGPSLPFEITSFEPGCCWAWKVGGVEATGHRVEPLGPDRCRLSFGVPWIALPYLAVCRVALGRIAELAAGPRGRSDPRGRRWGRSTGRSVNPSGRARAAAEERPDRD